MGKSLLSFWRKTSISITYTIHIRKRIKHTEYTSICFLFHTSSLSQLSLYLVLALTLIRFFTFVLSIEESFNIAYHHPYRYSALCPLLLCTVLCCYRKWKPNETCIDTPVNISLFDTTNTLRQPTTKRSLFRKKVDSHVQTYIIIQAEANTPDRLTKWYPATTLNVQHSSQYVFRFWTVNKDNVFSRRFVETFWLIKQP